MKSVLEKFADHPEHQSSDSTFLVFMSRGTSNGIIGIDHNQEDPDILAHDTIFEIFNNRNCSTLRHKPKVIIIHAWQLGTVSEQGAVAASAEICIQSSKSDKNTIWEDATGKEHVEKDFICFHSTIPYDIFWEDDQVGSLFISLLIDCFQQFSWCCHVEEVFRKVGILYLEVSTAEQNNPEKTKQTKNPSFITSNFLLFTAIYKIHSIEPDQDSPNK